MQRIFMHCLRIIYALSLLAICTNSHAATYQAYSPATYTWLDISATGTTVALVDDGISALVNIGFTFNYGGTNYTQLRIASNGMLYFNAAGGNSGAWYNNVAINSATQTGTYGITNAIMPYWTDLNPAGVATRVRYQMLGVTPNRQFVVSYLAVPTYNATGANTFQVVLNEDGTFIYNYQSTNTQGGGTGSEGATIGYHVSAGDFVQFSMDTASAPNGSAIFWSKPPLLSNLKTVALLSDPINNVTNPKNIPGAVVQYTIRITNSGTGKVGDNAMVITDSIPANTTFFSGNVSGGAPYIFTNGTPTSNLSCPFIALANLTDCVDFSNNGGTTWVYVPNGAYDAAVTHVRFKLTGAMSANTGAGGPFFELKFNVQVK